MPIFVVEVQLEAIRAKAVLLDLALILILLLLVLHLPSGHERKVLMTLAPASEFVAEVLAPRSGQEMKLGLLR